MTSMFSMTKSLFSRRAQTSLPSKRERNLELREKSKALRSSTDYSVNGQWPSALDQRPWFDQPDALDYIASKKLKSADTEMLTQWVEEGYIVKDLIPPEKCDHLVKVIEDDVWGLQSNMKGLNIIGLKPDNAGPPLTIAQQELNSFSQEQKDQMYNNNNWRIHGLMDHDDIAYEIAHNPEAKRICSLLFGEEATPGFSLSFGNGSEQQLHQDIAIFHIYPQNFLIGVWIALEDIHADSGPLIYYPKTHKLGLWHKHAQNYPKTNVETLGPEARGEYMSWLEEESKDTSERKSLLIKKGQALFWHAGLAHGGSKRKDRSLSRHSYVVHMIPKNTHVDKRIICSKN